MRLLVLLVMTVCLSGARTAKENLHDHQEHLLKQVKTWADRLGADLWLFGNMVTRRNLVIESYRQAEVVRRDGESLVHDIAQRIREMTDQKVAAVQRVMDTAGQVAASQPDHVDPGYEYYSAKDLLNNLTHPAGLDDEDGDGADGDEPRAEEQRAAPDRHHPPPDAEMPRVSDGDEIAPETGSPEEAAQRASSSQQEGAAAAAVGGGPPKVDKRRLNLTENHNFFDIPVNTDHSAVHVPSNVYDRAKEVIKGIKWSEKLDSIFKSNYERDPTLSWQYFGSSTGFMRQYPAMVWKQDPVDLFDCRTRSWYIEAATSPKDVVILVDRSGSMTGMRREIAKHVVTNILDTLGNNDFVNVFTFSNVTEPLMDCFNDTLVQANLANVRQLKERMDDFKTEDIANFVDALTIAFELLKNYRVGSRNKTGAGCNQAIMLITDGVQYNYKEVFEKYNWVDMPYMPVRVFTYLIGREVSDEREVKWMACANQGFYVHLSTFAEVREQVLQYVPVMARPLVLWAKKPRPTWSPVYADVADPKLTNWLWVQRQRRDQKERFLAHRQHQHVHTRRDDGYRVHRLDQQHDHDGETQSYTLMTSVSMPVYDSRANANITEHILVKEAHWITVTRETPVANLLGVAGTDVPIKFIQELMSPHALGVNAYCFIITNNGYILIHPDLRPVFEGILKPAYNRVDLAEVELTDDDLEPRDFNNSLLAMRKEIIFRVKGKKTLDVKYHVDDMRRVIRNKRHYFYQEIVDTPFSLVVALPHKYGAAKIQLPNYKEDIHRMLANENTITNFFAGEKWRIHPDWIYCKYLTGNQRFNTSEEEMRHFLAKMQTGHWKWGQSTIKCDRNLVQNLVFDAKQTRWFDQNIGEASKDEKGRELIQRFGITTAFMATYSGLTRWQDFPQNVQRKENKTYIHFSEIHNRAIDEVWYKRAVEQHYTEEESFVYSVPFDEGDENDTLVTASHAVFVGNENKTSVAVVGYQFYRTAFFSLFRNITTNCGGQQCAVTCESEDISCYILDNNAYVVLSYEAEDTGKWFGDVHPGVMRLLVNYYVYNPVRMYDYQAVCFPAIGTNNPATRFTTPFQHAYQILQWTVGTLLYFLHVAFGNQDFNSYDMPEPTIASDQPATKANEKEFDRNILINKTRPTSCDEERWLYELIQYKIPSSSPYNKKMINCTKPFIVQNISASNLIILVIRNGCKFEEEEIYTPHPEEVYYNTSLVCRIKESDLPRKRINQCTNKHINESLIVLCGRCNVNVPAIYLLLAAICVISKF